MTPTEVKERLLARAVPLCERLLPGGKLHGHTWKCGNLQGEPGDSLAVEIGGAKAGVWSDFATGRSGSNLLELWFAVSGVAHFGEALRQAKEWLGVSDSGSRFRAAVPKRKPAKAYVAPSRDCGILPTPNSPVRAYLTQERMISAEVLDRYKVLDTHARGGYVFLSEDTAGKLLFWKAISLKRDEKGKKQVCTSTDSPKVLFGKQAIGDHDGTLVITEGEIDTLTVAQVMGLPAVSVPFGAKGESEDGKSPNDEWIEHDWEWLEQFTTIILCFDADAAGRDAVQVIHKRLGPERCRIAEMPEGCKDANECLQKGKTDELMLAIFEAKSIDPKELRGAASYADKVWERMHPKALAGHEFFFPFAFRIRPAELTIWTGYSGSGKSVFISQLMVHLASKGEKICIGSFEQLPAHTLQIIVHQAANVIKFKDRAVYDRVFAWVDKHFWVFDQDGVKDRAAMLQTMRYARRRYNVTQFVIDSLMKCGIAEDDYNEQARFVEELANWARREGVHVHLVAHARKGKDEKEVANKFDVKGTGAITDNASNVVTLWKNKKKGEDMCEAMNNNNETLWEKIRTTEFDGRISMSKQRETGIEPWSHLFFDLETRRFKAPNQHKYLGPYVDGLPPAQGHLL